MSLSETEMLLKGYGLTTAEFFYRMPDYTNVLNVFLWQDYDVAPDHPRLFQFIEFWQDEIEGPLHSVRFIHRKMVAPGEWRNVTGEFTLTDVAPKISYEIFQTEIFVRKSRFP